MSTLCSSTHPSPESLTIPEAIGFNIEKNASYPYFTFVDPTTPSGVRVLTHLDFGQAAHRAAHIVRPDCSGPDGEVVAILALSDTIHYQAIVAGCIIAGLVPFPISPRNPPAAVVHLLNKTSCKRIVATTVTLKSLLGDVQSQYGASSTLGDLEIVELPSLYTVYPQLRPDAESESLSDLFSPYPVSKPHLEDICMFLHSSGTTGFPKAIPQTHRTLMNWASFPPVTDMRDAFSRSLVSCAVLPTFHAFGVYTQLLIPIYGLISMTVYPPTATASHRLPIMASPSNVLEQVLETGTKILVVVPSILQVWAANEQVVRILATLEGVIYAGGSLAPKIGMQLVEAGVHLVVAYGATEFGAPTHTMQGNGVGKEWEYIRFSERTRIRWVDQRDGTFECQVLACETHRPVVLNLPDVEGYATSDLWVPHPTKKNLWKIVGRIDDVIIHSSGEKTVPGPMEDIILSSPLVQGVILFGHERVQTGVLIELNLSTTGQVHDNVRMRDTLWPIVEEANEVAPAFSRIFKDMILFTSVEKPLPRSGKGTILRKAALALYNEEIDASYEIIHSSADAHMVPVIPPASWTTAEIKPWLAAQASELLSGRDIIGEVDLFEQGFDSLTATHLRMRIASALHSSSSIASIPAGGLSQSLVYSHPTINDLSVYLSSLSEDSGLSQTTDDVRSQHVRAIEDLIAKYSVGLDDLPPTIFSTQPAPAVVLLTGSTGNLGSEILIRLLQDDRVDHVYALNRLSQGMRTVEQRHFDAFKQRGLDTDTLTRGKVTFLTGNAAQPSLGLNPEQYTRLMDSVTLIIHNAWKLDFNLSLSAFEPHVVGTRNLIDLLNSGSNRIDAKFVFTSSIASAQSWPTSNGQYPEESLADATFAVGGGYGEGKYVAERILSKSGLNATSIRIGQLSGGKSNGAWATTDWLPILVKSSVSMGVLPDMAGEFSWIPMDDAAAEIVDTALGNQVLPFSLNLVHPQPSRARDIILAIRVAIANTLDRNLKIIPFVEWIADLDIRAQSATIGDLADIPAIKLLDFFRLLCEGDAQVMASNSAGREAGGHASFSTSKMMEATTIMKNVHALGMDDASMWVRFWREAEFLK